MHEVSRVIDKSWNASVRRRVFLRSISAAFAVAAFDFDRGRTLTLRVLRNSTTKSFRDGLAMGLSEARRAASLYSREPISVVDGSADVVVGMSESYPDTHSVYLNCGARSNLYRARCDSRVFHIEASEAMYANASRMARMPSVHLWSPALERYGAAQLNDRFRSEFHRDMDSDAWCAWFAVKIVWESAMRMRGDGPEALRHHLSNQATQFDGHKGAPLSFRSPDHQLRQPLYAIAGGRPPQDVPDVARSNGSIREVLDSIIPAASCQQ
jgi:hypothetical protein